MGRTILRQRLIVCLTCYSDTFRKFAGFQVVHREVLQYRYRPWVTIGDRSRQHLHGSLGVGKGISVSAEPEINGSYLGQPVGHCGMVGPIASSVTSRALCASESAIS